MREDGTEKGLGFLGPLTRPDGGISTELSIGVQINGKETLIPSIVPTLTEAEIEELLSKEGIPSDAIVQKAVDHATSRLKEGRSPFLEEDEGVEDQLDGITETSEEGIMSQIRQIISNVVNAPENLNTAKIWSENYQSEGKLIDQGKFALHAARFSDGSAPEEPEIDRVSKLVSTAFAADLRMDKATFTDLMKKTAYHESLGGQFNEQLSGGPAKGWWQVEPATAKDLLEKSKGVILGPKAEALIAEVNLTFEDLENMSDEEFGEALKIPVVNAVFAGAKYVRSLFKSRR